MVDLVNGSADFVTCRYPRFVLACVKWRAVHFGKGGFSLRKLALCRYSVVLN